MESEEIHSEALHVANAMIKYGGSFVAHLGYALQYADVENTKRIKEAFPYYWEQYTVMAERDATREAM